MADKKVGLVIDTGAEEAEKSWSSLNKEIEKTPPALKKITDNVTKTKDLFKSVENVFKKSAIVGWLGTVKNTVSSLAKASSKQAEYIENLNFLEQAYNNSSESGMRLLDTLEKTVGYDPAGLARNLAVFRQFGNALDMDDKIANRLAENLMKLSIDTKSITGDSLDKVMSRYTSAMAGNTRAVRAYGIDVTIAGMQQQALNLGIEKSVASMSRAEKSILMYITMAHQMSAANGDMARTVNSVANQYEIFKSQISETGRLLGGFLIPILKTILPLINGVMMAINILLSSLLSLFGIDASSFADEFGTIAVDLEDVSDGFDGIGASADKAGKAAKEAQKSLRGFDKLNVIKTPTAGTSGSGGSVGTGGGVGGLGGIDASLLDKLGEYDLHLDKIKNKATEIRDSLLEWLGFTKEIDPVTGEISWKYQGLGKTISNMWGSFLKLNAAGKLFVGIGIVKAFQSIWNIGKKLFTLLGNSGLAKTVKSLINPFTNLGKAIIGGWGNKVTLMMSLDLWRQQLGVMDKIKISLMSLLAIDLGKSGVSAGLEQIFESGNKVLGVLELLGGTASGAIGGAIAGFALLGQTLGPQAAIIGGVVGGLASLVLGILDYNEKVSEAKRLTDLYGESIANLDESTRNNLIVSLDEQATLQSKVDKLGELVDANGKVIGGNDELVQQILNDLNKAYGLNLEIQDGKITKNGEEIGSTKNLQTEINKLIAIKKAEAIQNAFQDEYNESVKKTKEYTRKVTEENERYKKKIQELAENYQKMVDKYGEGSRAAEIAYGLITDETENHKKKVQELNDEYKENEETVTRWDELQRALAEGNTEEIERLTKEFTTYQGKTLEEAQKETIDLANMTAEEIIKAYSKPSEKKYSVAYDVTINDSQAKFELKTFKDLYNGMKINARLTVDTSGAKRTLDKFEGQYSVSTKKAEGGLFSSGVWRPMKTYANGGFPTQGELFMAREKGPELVGRIGNSTAVMNNNQILDQMTIAVARGMSANKQSTNVNIIAEGDTEGMLDFIKFKEISRNRQYGL